MAGMYGFNRYAQGPRPGTMQFFGGPQGRLQLGMGNLANKIQQSIDRPNPRAAGMAAGAGANAAAMNAGPTAQGQAAGAAAGQAAVNASAAAQPLGQWARGNAMAPRPMMPDGAPDYALGTPAPRPMAHYGQNQAMMAPTQKPLDRITGGHGGIQQGPPPAAGIPGGTMAPKPGPAPGQAPMPPVANQMATLNQSSAPLPGAGQGPAPGQAPMVSPAAMTATLNAPINPANYQAHSVGGKNVLLRNGADPSNPSPQDVMVFQNGQWSPGSDDDATELYNQLHIEDI